MTIQVTNNPPNVTLSFDATTQTGGFHDMACATLDGDESGDRVILNRNDFRR